MNDYQEYKQAQGFYDKLDPSLLTVYGLVRGSYNVLINDSGNIATRKGYTLYGEAGTQDTGIKSAYTWETSTNNTLLLRTRYDALQVYHNSAWRDILTGLGSSYKMRFAMWWDKTELKDRLLAVNGGTVIYNWTGGMTEIASWTVNSVTKKYTKNASGGNSFTFSSAGKTIVQSTGTDFVTLGFAEGDTISVRGTTSNNGIYTIRTVTTNTITVASTDILVNEVTTSTSSIVGILGKETWANERFTTTGTKTIDIAGATFTYNAGENSPTLTLTTDPSASATVGGFVYQEVLSETPTGGDFPAGFPIDIIASNLNQVYVGYSKARNVYFSKQSDFGDFAYNVTVRVTGEGGTINLDNNLRSISVDDDTVVIMAGKSDVHRVTFTNFSDGSASGELFLAPKSKTSYGQASESQEAFVKTKNGILYLSQEPTIDFLNNVSQESIPVSDPIKRLVTSLNRTDASGVYTKNNAFFLFPNESIMLIYDIQRQFWQPPQIVSGSCLSIDENGNVLVHSSQTDESFTLFSGMNDNGVSISFSAVTNILTSGKRSKRKTYDEIFVEVLVNGNTNALNCSMYSGYRGASGIATFQIGAGDDARFIEEPAISSGFGSDPFGSTPFGSLFPDAEEDSEIGAIRKLYEIQGMNRVEAFTQQMQFSTDELNAYFELVCFGFNPQATSTSAVDIMKD